MSLTSKLNNKLFQNTFYLYLLTFSNYFLGFITLPYQTRIFGPDIYGTIVFAIAFVTYFQLFMDFGFILSATKTVSENKLSKDILNKILTSVTFTKIVFFLISVVLFVLLCAFSSYLREHFLLILLYLINAGLTSLMPDYIYRGLEDMKKITIRSVFIRLVFMSLIFVFLRDSSQVLLVPISLIVGSISALAIVFLDLKYTYSIGFVRTSRNFANRIIADSLPYFFSRIASSVFSASNTVILGLTNASNIVIGLYGSADRVRGLSSQAYSPLADSLYPYLIRTKNFVHMYKIMLYAGCIIIPAMTILWIYSIEISQFIFGDEFAETGLILRYLIPLMIITLPNYIMGFPALTPLGKASWANYSVEIAVGIQIIGLILLFVFEYVNVYSLIILTTFSELMCTLIRVFVFIKSNNNIR